ncbi:hypothetical protein N7U49_37235 [Streptomyces sp. AD2-2]|nr:hypothetical protein N7U49_37235 [Streptomyces sp. AD2-2]
MLDDFRGLYWDTALSSGPTALPTLLAFARPGHILFGSDWPYAPAAASQYSPTASAAVSTPASSRPSTAPTPKRSSPARALPA